MIHVSIRCWMALLLCTILLGGGCAKPSVPIEDAKHKPVLAREENSAVPVESQSAVGTRQPQADHINEDQTDEMVDPGEALKRKFRARRKRQLDTAAEPGSESAALVPVEMKMPAVTLTDAEEKRCHLKVGHSMPDFRLPDLEGQQQSLHKLLGDKLTVVLLWSSAGRYSLQELGDLGPDVVDRFVEQGVEVVAIAERETPRVAHQSADEVGAQFPILVDAKGASLQQCAADALPVTYLVDSTGKILWFDIEYSRSTRRDLQQALRFALHDLRTAGRPSRVAP